MNRMEAMYYPWLLNFIIDENIRKRYSKLFKALGDTSFEYKKMSERDMDRALDGRALRWRFEKKMEHLTGGIPMSETAEFEDRPCSVLEMMVALSLRMEENIMTDGRYGDRTGQWFWEMLINLGVGYMSDDNFNKPEFDRCISNFHNRTYDSDGKGCLFRSEKKSMTEMSHMDIWYQMNAHLADYIE